MRVAITISLLFIFLHGFGQDWTNEPIDVGSATWNCYITRAGYAKASTVIMVPGSGQIGATNGLDTNNAFVFGPHYMMKYDGWKGYVRGKKWNIITLLPTSGSTTLSNYNTAVDTIIARLDADTCRLYITGLSLGASMGARLISTDASGRPHVFTSALLMSVGSTANIDSVGQIRAFTENDGHYFGLIGNTDSTGRPLTQQIYRFMQAINPSSSKLYVYPGGHDSWNTYYDTAWRSVDGINVYEWLDNYSKRPYANAEQTSITTSESSVTLNGIVDSISGGFNGRNRTITWTKKSGGSATITSPNSEVTTVTGLSEGSYVFTLTSANAEGGLSASVDVSVTVGDIKIIGVKDKKKRWHVEKL